MSEFVDVSLGDTPSVATYPKTRIMCLIGKTTANVGVINEVQGSTIADTSNLPTGSNEGQLSSSDNLYKAAVKYFQENPGGTLVLGGVSASGALYAQQLLSKITTSVWNTAYSPLEGSTLITGTLSGGDRVAINEIEIMLNAAGVAEINADASYGSEPEGNWYVIDNTLVADNTSTADRVSVELVDGVYTGKITFTGSTIEIVPDAVNPVDVSVANIEAIRVSLRSESISETFKDLLGAGIKFDGFAFAYDDAKEGDTATNSKYAAAECPGGVGWLADVILGCNLVKQFNANKQRCMFYFGLPEKVLPTDDISDEMAVGTAYASGGATGTIKYDAIRGVVGTNMYVGAFVSKQSYGANAIDPAVAAMAALAKRDYRKPLTFAVSGISQLTADAPSGAEFSMWKTSKINTYKYSKAADVWEWGSNFTFGATPHNDINHVRCKNKFAEIVEAVLNTIVRTNLTYDTVGYNGIRSTLVSAQNSSIGIYIDDKGTIVIPNEDLVRREGNLTVGEEALLASLRATKTVDGISVGYAWKGDIEYINVTSITMET